MNITKKLIKNVGKRSPIIRAAMEQSGDKIRIDAMKKAFLSIGVCRITADDIAANNYSVREKHFSFSAEPLVYVLLEEEEFNRYPPISNSVAFEVARIRNGVVGIRRKRGANA